MELRLLTDSAYAEQFDIVVDELTDQYVAGEFHGAEQERVERYFFKSEDRRNKLSFASTLKRARADRQSEIAGAEQDSGRARKERESDVASPKRRSPKQQKRSPFTSYLAIAASVLIVLGVGFSVWRAFIYQSDVDKGLLALNAAYRDQRPIEARISGFNYAPLPNQRGAPIKLDYVQHDLAASLLLSDKHPGAASNHAIGKYYLAEHQYDKAIEQLKAALALDPRNAKIHSDLGAALLERGKAEPSDSPQGKGAKDFAESLAHLSNAVELDNTQLEALFNRALLYRLLALLPQAEADWHTYLQKELDPKWAEEARQNLRQVEEQEKRTSLNNDEVYAKFLDFYAANNDEESWRVVSSYHARSGNIIVERLLDDYLESAKNGRNDKAHSTLQALSDIGELERLRANDHFFSALALFYRLTTPEQRPKLVEARELMRQGHAGWGRMKAGESLDLFTRARRLFDETGDTTESQVAAYWIAFCYYRDHKEAESHAMVEYQVSACETSGFGWLVTRNLYLQSLLEFNLNEHSNAIAFARRSLELAEKSSDTVGMLNALSSLVEYSRYLGDYDQSLGYVQRSLPLVSLISLDPIQGSRHYGFEATAFAAAGWYTAAAECQREALRFTLITQNPSVISYTYAFLGAINGQIGNYAEAVNNTQRAYEVAEGHSIEAADRELMAYAQLQLGHIYRRSEDFGKAISSYNMAIQLYETLQNPNLYQAHKGRFLCFMAQNEIGLANAELITTLNLVEKYRNKIFDENNRVKFFEREQSFYDAAIDFLYTRRNDSKKGLELAEFSRARSLLDLIYSDTKAMAQRREPDLIPRSVSLPLSPDEIVLQLPPDTEILQYAVLEGKLLVWVVSKEGISSSPKEISQKELNEKVLGYLSLAASPSNDDNSELSMRAKDLFEILIKPVQSWLSTDKQICIVPDKVLSYLPFAALLSPSGRYLIEDYHLIVSPSATMFLVGSKIAKKKSGARDEQLLSVGNPTFDGAAFPSFPDLPSAAREAREIAFYYKNPGTRTLIQEQARRDSVLQEMEKAEVIHLAVHSDLDTQFPLRSKLLLAKSPAEGPDAEAAGVLYAYDIYGMDLKQTRLVVLSACQTGAAHYHEGEGMLSLARSFTAAHVPLVVASLWPVDSNATADLMISFHKLRRVRGLSTVEALRTAQLNMLNDPEGHFHQPYYWAPFVVIGGHAEF